MKMKSIKLTHHNYRLSVYAFSNEVIHQSGIHVSNETKYSTMDQVKFVEDRL